MLAAASLIDAQQHFDAGRHEHARLHLDSAEGFLAQPRSRRTCCQAGGVARL